MILWFRNYEIYPILKWFYNSAVVKFEKDVFDDNVGKYWSDYI